MHLDIQQLSVRYGANAVLEAVSLSLAAGEVGVLLGPSGCGKTTLLRAVAGLVPSAGGLIRIHGTVVSGAGTHTPPEQRGVGMVFQDHALFPHLSVAANVAFGLRGGTRAQRQSRVAEMLTLVGLGQHADRYPHALSGGQQQRVALARALAPRPHLLLLDEPFANLDVALRERLAQELGGILRAAGTTALLVTHDPMEAFAVADRVGVMQAGRLHQWDDPYSLYHRPATRFVAGFVGHGVLARGRVVATPAGAEVQTPLGPLRGLVDCPLPSAYPDGWCDVLLRADDVVHDDDAPVRARVVRKSFRGAEYLYTLELADGLQVLALVPSHHDHAVGEAIGLRPAVDHVVTFAPESERL